MQNQKSVAKNVSLDGGLYRLLRTIKNTRYFSGNLSKTLCKIVEEAWMQNITLTLDGKQYTLKELEDMVNNADYNFRDIKVCPRKITEKFRKAFNDIENNELKAALYNFIKAVSMYLNKIKANVLCGPSISTSVNLAVYQDGWLMLYVNINDIQNDTIHISRFLQFNQNRHQPENPIVWNKIMACLGVSNVGDLRVTVDDLDKLTDYFLSL